MVWQTLINGAVCMGDAKEVIVDGELGFKIPDMDKSYKYAILTDEISENNEFFMMMCSRDGKEFKIAMRIQIGDKSYGMDDLSDKMFFPRIDLGNEEVKNG